MIIGLLVLLTCPYYLGSVSLLGEELEELIKKVMDQPKEVVDRVKKMLGN